MVCLECNQHGESITAPHIRSSRLQEPTVTKLWTGRESKQEAGYGCEELNSLQSWERQRPQGRLKAKDDRVMATSRPPSRPLTALQKESQVAHVSQRVGFRREPRGRVGSPPGLGFRGLGFRAILHMFRLQGFLFWVWRLDRLEFRAGVEFGRHAFYLSAPGVGP